MLDLKWARGPQGNRVVYVYYANNAIASRREMIKKFVCEHIKNELLRQEIEEIDTKNMDS